MDRSRGGGGKLTWATRLAPRPVILCLLRACLSQLLFIAIKIDCIIFRSCTYLSTAICQRRKTESIIAPYAVQLTVLVLMFLRKKSLKNPEVNISCNNRRIQLCQTRPHADIHLTSASVLSF